MTCAHLSEEEVPHDQQVPLEHVDEHDSRRVWTGLGEVGQYASTETITLSL